MSGSPKGSPLLANPNQQETSDPSLPAYNPPLSQEAFLKKDTPPPTPWDEEAIENTPGDNDEYAATRKTPSLSSRRREAETVQLDPTESWNENHTLTNDPILLSSEKTVITPQEQEEEPSSPQLSETLAILELFTTDSIEEIRPEQLPTPKDQSSDMRHAALVEQSASDPLLNAVLLNYQIKSKIAEGGMGIVYRAEHVTIGRPAAIKILRREYCQNEITIRRFYQEGRLVNQIRHRNIIDIFDFGRTEDGRVFYIMELLEGESLADRIQRDGSLDLKEALPLMEQAVEALEAIHDHGIIHRDLKPENLWITKEESGTFSTLKLLDFGIAKLVGLESIQDKITQTGSLVGTPQYMSPEQIQGQEVDGRSDVYSLGIVFYEMLIGQTPFEQKTLGQILSMHLSGNFPEIPEQMTAQNIPEGMQAIIQHTLSRHAADRYVGMKELLADLRSFSISHFLEVAFPAAQQPVLTVDKTLSPQKNIFPATPPQTLQKTPNQAQNKTNTNTTIPSPLKSYLKEQKPSTRNFWVGLLAIVLGALIPIMAAIWWFYLKPANTISSQKNIPTSVPENSPTPSELKTPEELRQAAVDSLQQNLQKDAPRVRAAAAKGIGEIREMSSQARLEKLLLEEEDPEVQIAVATGLGDLRMLSAKETLQKARPTQKGRLQVAIDTSLMTLGDQDAKESLFEAGNSEDPSIRIKAATALGRQGFIKEAKKILSEISLKQLTGEEKLLLLQERAYFGDKRAQQVLKAMLVDESPTEEERLWAATTLAQLGYDAGRSLLQNTLQTNQNDESKIIAANALLYLGDFSGIEALKEGLQTPSPVLRGKSARSLGLLGEKEFIPILAEVLGDEDGQVQVEASVSLLSILGLTGKTLGENSLAWIDDMLLQEQSETRIRAVRALASLEDKNALPRLQTALTDPNAKVVEEAALALSKRVIDQKEQEALDILKPFLEGTRKRLKIIAQAAFASTGDQLAQQGLLASTSERGERLRTLAMRMAGRIGQLDVLLKGLQDKSDTVKLEAALALAEQGNTSAQDILQKESLSRNPVKALRAKTALLSSDASLDPDDVNLDTLLNSSSENRRALGASLSAKVDGEKSEEIVRRALYDPSPIVRLAAIEAAEQKGLIPLIRILLRDKDPAVRAAAQSAVKRTQQSNPTPNTATSLPDKTPSLETTQPEEESSLLKDEKAIKLRESQSKMSQGDIALAKGKPRQALKYYKSAHLLVNRSDIFWYYGECYRRIGDSSDNPKDQKKYWTLAKESYDRFASKRSRDKRASKAKEFSKELSQKIKDF